MDTQTIAPAQREALLDALIARETLAGAVLVTRAGLQAVLEVRGKEVNHTAHAIMYASADRKWWLPWLVQTIRTRRNNAKYAGRYMVTVDEFGRELCLPDGATAWEPL